MNERQIGIEKMRSTDKSRADALTYRLTEFDVLLDGYREALQDGPHKECLETRLALKTAFLLALQGEAIEQHEAAPSPYDGLTEEFVDEVARLCDDAPGSRNAVYAALRSCNAIIAPAAAQPEPPAADERAFPATDGYFVYDRAGGHVEFYDTDAERDAAHREAIAEYRRDAAHDQEWPAEVEGIVSGVVTHTTGELKVHEDSYEFEPRAVATQARASSPNAAGAIPAGSALVPIDPDSAMLDRAVAFALNVKIGGDYRWTEYMRDLWARFINVAPQRPEQSR